VALSLYRDAAILVNAATYPELADVDPTGKKYLATSNSYLKSLLCKTQLQVDVPRRRGVIYKVITIGIAILVTAIVNCKL